MIDPLFYPRLHNLSQERGLSKPTLWSCGEEGQSFILVGTISSSPLNELSYLTYFAQLKASASLQRLNKVTTYIYTERRQRDNNISFSISTH